MNLTKWLPFRFRRKKEERDEPRASSERGLGRTEGWPAYPDIHGLWERAFRDPFALLQSDRWFGDFSPTSFTPRVDVIDEKKHLRVTAEIPGLGPEDVQLSVQDGLLSLRGEKRVESSTEEEGCYRTECSYGAFERNIPLPDDVDPESAEATFDKGVLTVRLPKRGEPTPGRRIPIKHS